MSEILSQTRNKQFFGLCIHEQQNFTNLALNQLENKKSLHSGL